MRFGDKTKGYQFEWFNSAFERYLPPSSPTVFETLHPLQVNKNTA